MSDQTAYHPDTVAASVDAKVQPAALECAGHLSRHAQKLLIRAALLVTDSAAILGGLLFAVFVRFGTTQPNVVAFAQSAETIGYRKLSLLATPVWLLLLYLEGLYDLDRLFWGSKEFSRVARAVALGVLAVVLASYAFKLPGLSRAWLILGAVFTITLLVTGRLVVREGIHWARRTGKMCLRTLLVGYNEETLSLVEILRKNRSAGLVPVGYVGRGGEAMAASPVLPRLGKTNDLASVVVASKIDTVMIASSAFSHDRASRLIQMLRGLPVDIHVSSGFFDVLTQRVLVREISGTPLLTIKGIGLSRTAVVTKRVFDLLVSTTVLVIGAPFWIALAAAIKATSRGPVLYRQPRIGRDGQPFTMYKLRSMVADADAMLPDLTERNEADGAIFKIRDDPRVTKIGRWLRRFSIDEAAQIINVFKGEMSLIGPRPPLPHEVAEYERHHLRRLEVTPGMTGLWQISGRSDLSFEDMVKLDLFYIENWSLGLDFSILLRTIPAVIQGRGAY